MKVFNIKFKVNKSQKGFTLIELAIYMGISMIVLLILTDLLVAIFNTKLTTQSTGGVSQDGRFIYTRLIYDINRAQSVTTPANLGDTSNSLILSIDGTQYTYSLQNGNIVLNDSLNTSALNGADTQISGLTFKRIGNVSGKHTFQINYLVTSKIVDKGTTETQSFQTTAGLR